MATLLFASYVHYLQVHLLSDAHHPEINQAGTAPASYLAGLAAEKEGSEHHDPHSKSDHQLQLVRKQSGGCEVLTFIAPAMRLIVASPEASFIQCGTETAGPPAESPPDPASPRGPPTV